MPVLAALPAGVLAVGAVTAAAATATAAIGAASAIQQAQATRRADDYNAEVASNDAQVATWQRQQQEQEYATQSLIAQQEGAQETSRMELRNGAIIASQINSAASDGLTISGSTLDTISGSAANNELSANDQAYKTQIAAYQAAIGASNASYNSTIQANRDEAEAGLSILSGQNAEETGLFSAAGDIAQGFASVGETYGGMYDMAIRQQSLSGGSTLTGSGMYDSYSGIFD